MRGGIAALHPARKLLHKVRQSRLRATGGHPCTTSAPSVTIPTRFDAALARRGAAPAAAEILALDTRRREVIHAAETAQAEQNRASKEVGRAKASGDEAEFDRLRALVADKKAEVADMQAQARELTAS